MENYLGEFPVDIDKTIYKDYTPKDWALYFIGAYGGIDGAHHKDWVLDQVARILNGAEIIVVEARWGQLNNNHTEYRVRVGEPTNEYIAWVADMMNGEDGPNTYSYDEGAP